MKYRFLIRLSAAIVVVPISAGLVKANERTVADAYARGSANGLTWTIGTKSVQMTFDGRGGEFRLTSFLNKSCEPPLEYVEAKTAAAPFSLDSENPAKPAAEADSQWTLKNGSVRQVPSGGRPAVQLDVTLTRASIVAQFHVLAFPGTPILRQWVEIENAGSGPVGLKSPLAASFRLRGDEAASYVHCWMIGGHAAPDQGKLEQRPITAPYGLNLIGTGTSNLVPWMALHRSNGPKDGLFIALEYLGTWSLAIDHEAAGPLTATAGIPELKVGGSPTGPAAGNADGYAGRLPRWAGQHGGVALRLAIRILLGLHERRLLCALPMRGMVVLLLAEPPGTVHGPLGQSRHEHQRRDADYGVRDALG